MNGDDGFRSVDLKPSGEDEMCVSTLNEMVLVETERKARKQKTRRLGTMEPSKYIKLQSNRGDTKEEKKKKCVKCRDTRRQTRTSYPQRQLPIVL